MSSSTLIAVGVKSYMLSQNRSKVDCFQLDDETERRETSNFLVCVAQKQIFNIYLLAIVISGNSLYKGSIYRDCMFS